MSLIDRTSSTVAGSSGLSWRSLVLFGLAACALPIASCPLLAQPANSEVLVGPVTVTQDVAGIKVDLVLSSSFRLESKSDGLYLDARVDADLQDLQRKFASIVDTFPLPKENCKSYKPDNLVVDLPTKSLEARGGTAVINIAGKVDVWTCLENPVPNTKVEWEMKQIGFIKTKIPVLKTWPGSPIKNKTATQPFEATLPVVLQRTGDRSIGLVLGNPDIKLKGQYVFITNGLLDLAGLNVNEEARKAMEKAIAPNDLIVAIPEEYAAMQPVITAASFADRNGRLIASVSLSAKVPVEKINEFAKTLISHLNAK